MRKSHRIAEKDLQLGAINPSKLISLRNTRRGHLGRITRIINNIIQHLQDGFFDDVTKLYQELLITFAKFKAINTEYMCYEIDILKIKETEDMTEREEDRIKEVKLLIDKYSQNYSRIVPEEPRTEDIQTSFYNVEPNDSASNISWKTSSGSYLRHLKETGINSRTVNNIQTDNYSQITTSRFLPKPPSVTLKGSSSIAGSLKSRRKLKNLSITPTNNKSTLQIPSIRFSNAH